MQTCRKDTNHKKKINRVEAFIKDASLHRIMRDAGDKEGEDARLAECLLLIICNGKGFCTKKLIVRGLNVTGDGEVGQRGCQK